MQALKIAAMAAILVVAPPVFAETGCGHVIYTEEEYRCGWNGCAFDEEYTYYWVQHWRILYYNGACIQDVPIEMQYACNYTCKQHNP